MNEGADVMCSEVRKDGRGRCRRQEVEEKICGTHRSWTIATRPEAEFVWSGRELKKKSWLWEHYGACMGVTNGYQLPESLAHVDGVASITDTRRVPAAAIKLLLVRQKGILLL